MPGLLATVVDARARRAALVDEAAGQRRQLGRYIDALDPASRLIERVFSAISYLLDRPAIPVGIIAAVLVIKPRRILKLGLLAWKIFSWAQRWRARFRTDAN